MCPLPFPIPSPQPTKIQMIRITKVLTCTNLRVLYVLHAGVVFDARLLRHDVGGDGAERLTALGVRP